MSTKNTINENLLAVFGMMIVAPVLLIMGTLAVLMLATPLIMAATVVAVATALLTLGTALTRETPVTPTLAKEDPMCESVDLFPVMETEKSEEEPVEMVGSLDDAPNAVVAASITRVFGPCPLGLMPGNIWKIGTDGHLSQPMCRPGAAALSALFRMSKGDAIDQSTCCECLYAGREVTFTVRESRGELAGKPG